MIKTISTSGTNVCWISFAALFYCVSALPSEEKELAQSKN